MSGHSKWATTKYRKGAQDKARAKLFAKLIRQIEVAAREGGGDQNANAALRTAVGKARDSSVPVDTIDRALKRGAGGLDGVRYESVAYEGYGPCGVAMIVECLSDNRNRTGAEIRSLFSRNGGSLAEPGAVAWQFERRGLVRVDGTAAEDDLIGVALEAGGDDVARDGDGWACTCPPGELAALRDALERAGFGVASAELAMEATQTVPLAEPGEVRKVLHLIEALDDHDDVQAVHDNADIPEEVLAAVEG